MNRWLAAARARLARAELNLDSARYAVALLRAPFDIETSAATMLFDLDNDLVVATVDVGAQLSGDSLLLGDARFDQLAPDTRPVVGVFVAGDEQLLLWFDDVVGLPFTPNGLPLVLSFPAEGIPL